MLSDKIQKINMFGWVQQRYFLITNEMVYNIKMTKIKRSIPISSLLGITKNLHGTKREFTLHVNSEYDYRFQSDKRDEIIGILKTKYAERNGINLTILGVKGAQYQNDTSA
jgi:phosphodiesterase/alkaline phosphatase D-like protein